MATRARGPLAGVGWLKNAINLGRQSPKAVFGGAALVAVLSLVPSLVTVPMQFSGTPGPGMIAAVMVISMLGGLLLVPLLAGYMGLIDQAERGRPARALDVFAPYRRGETLRLIGFGLAMLALYMVVVFAIVMVAGALMDWSMQVMMAQHGGDAAAAVPGLPDGFGAVIVLAFVLGVLMMGVYAISLGQVSIGGRGVFDAIGDGIVGSLKNALPLLVFMLIGLVLGAVIAVVFALAVMLLALVAKLIGMWLVFALMVPLYFGLLLLMFVVMFGVMYHLWRDVCDAGVAPDAGMPAMAA